MNSAFHKAKKLVKGRKVDGSEGKAKTQQESESRNHELDTDISALELKEFIELEMKAQQQARPDWLQLMQNRNKTKGPSTKELIMGLVRQPFVAAITPEMANKNRLRSSMNDQASFKEKKADVITRSLVSDIESNIGYNNLHSKNRLGSSSSVINASRKKSFVHALERPSPLIKKKVDLESLEAGNSENPRENVKKPEVLLGLLSSGYPLKYFLFIAEHIIKIQRRDQKRKKRNH